MTRALMLAAFFCLGAFSVDASENFSSADLMEDGAWSLSVYGRGEKSKPVVSLSGTNPVAIPTTAGATTIFSGSDADITLEQKATEVLAALDFRPKDGLQYRFKLGQVRDFDLEFSSGSQTNKLESTKDGFVWGAGVGGRIAPGSIVSTAVRWDVGYTRTDVSLDRLQGGTEVFSVDQRLRQDEFQGSVSFSRRWKALEPYAGLKVRRVVTRLTDEESKQRISGTKDGVSPFVGLQWAVAEKETFTVEGSFADERSLTAGFNVRF